MAGFNRKTEKALAQLDLIDPKAVEQRKVKPESLTKARKIFGDGIP